MSIEECVLTKRSALGPVSSVTMTNSFISWRKKWKKKSHCYHVSKLLFAIIIIGIKKSFLTHSYLLGHETSFTCFMLHEKRWNNKHLLGWKINAHSEDNLNLIFGRNDSRECTCRRFDGALKMNAYKKRHEHAMNLIMDLTVSLRMLSSLEFPGIFNWRKNYISYGAILNCIYCRSWIIINSSCYHFANKYETLKKLVINSDVILLETKLTLGIYI